MTAPIPPSERQVAETVVLPDMAVHRLLTQFERCIDHLKNHQDRPDPVAAAEFWEDYLDEWKVAHLGAYFGKQQARVKRQNRRSDRRWEHGAMTRTVWACEACGEEWAGPTPPPDDATCGECGGPIERVWDGFVLAADTLDAERHIDGLAASENAHNNAGNREVP